jgi:serine/threonine-protein kinase
MRALRVSEPELIPAGTRIGESGRYEIRERIGKGAMAEVYKAVDTRLNNRLVAVKMLSPSVELHTYKDRMRSLFIEEAQALSRVKDDNVVAVLDSGITPAGTPYMVMEFLNGQDLAQLLKKEEKLAVDRAVEIVLGVCAGVHACHLASIIHRDLKPANIFLDLTLKGEQPKVVDFSVAKIPLAGQQIEKEHTRTDLVVGTPTYMSPEQALGKPATALSDQYSIGAILYRCLTGRVPHGVLPSPRNDRSDIPEALEAAILRAMDARPESRFPSVFDLGRTLEPFASAAGRAKWKGYYTTPPIPLRPAFTGPIPSTAAGNGDPARTTVQPYDFHAHERTTHVNEGAPLEATTTTIDPQGPSTVGAGPPTTIENAGKDGAPVSLPGPRTAPREEHPSASSVGAKPPTASPRALVAGAVALAVVLIGVTLGVRAARSRSAVPVPAPPAWTQTTASRDPVRPVAPSTAASSPSAPPTPPPAAEQPSNNPAGDRPKEAEPARVVEEATPVTSPAAGTKKHRKRESSAPVQYTKDGVPLLSPE